MISILMPVYNAGLYLEQCLSSIEKQTFKNWELIAIDDFSSDNSLEILKKFAKKNEKIKFFSNQKKGILPALKLAFQHSKGDFITRMDADDLMPPEKLTLLYDKLIVLGRGYITTGLVSYFSDNELGNGYQKYQNWLNQLVIEQNHYSALYRECVLPSPAWLIHREDLILANDFTDGIYPEDYDLCFRFYEQGFKIIGIKEIVHLWRDHSSRTSRNNPIYASQHFLDLKVPWFLKTDYDRKRPLVVWGAGKKGKYMAQLLIKSGIEFHWLTNNPKKQGINIYGEILQPISYWETLQDPQTVLLVATPTERNNIHNFFNQKGLNLGKDFFWFC